MNYHQEVLKRIDEILVADIPELAREILKSVMINNPKLIFDVLPKVETETAREFQFPSSECKRLYQFIKNNFRYVNINSVSINGLQNAITEGTCGNIIAMINEIRLHTKLGFKDAKNAAEHIFPKQ